MPKINWLGNSGYCFPKPGTVKKVKCGVCGMNMDVERNVLGPTSFAGAMAGAKHRHDSFRCPFVETSWHQGIVNLKAEIYIAEMNKALDLKKRKKNAEKLILKTLKAYAAR